MTGPKQILRRGESCIYAIPIPCVRMRVLSAKCQRVLCQHSSTALFFPPVSPEDSESSLVEPGIWQSMGALATLSCINILLMQKSHLLCTYLKPGVSYHIEGFSLCVGFLIALGVANLALRFIVRRIGKGENSINI